MQGSGIQKQVRLQGPLGIERAAEIKGELADALASAPDVAIDLSAIEDIDLACLQVIYAAGVEAEAGGKRLRFEGTLPQRVARRLSACGFISGLPERAEDFEAALVDFHGRGAG